MIIARETRKDRLYAIIEILVLWARSSFNGFAGKDCERLWSIGLPEITNHKYQMVRQAHHPEPSRRANHNDQSVSGGPNLFCVLVIAYWNLKFVSDLRLFNIFL